ncbi:MAG: hypothetical protein ABI995_16660, partial [Acidobacteriota bacterium]
TGLKLDSQGRVTTTAVPNARVEINGIPVPIVYGSVGQWNVIVPYEINSKTATLQVFVDGLSSEKWILPVAASAPGIFTIGSTGQGRGAVLNQDNTVNTASNPAASGTVIQIFGTGGGQSSPASQTGSVTSASSKSRTALQVKAFLFDSEVPVTFAGPAPGLVSGALQVNALIPTTNLPRMNGDVPLSIEIDGVRSPAVSISIR